MLKKRTKQILSSARAQGWVLEPDAKEILKEYGISVPRFRVVREWEEALHGADDLGYPVVCKVVSPEVIHKSEKGGVIVGVDSEKKLKSAFNRLRRIKGFKSMLMEESVGGVELIVGAKNDYQFGPVILLGIGGTGVEIYQDTVIRMAPISTTDIDFMIKGLRAHQVITGFRGSPPVHLKTLTALLLAFSRLAMELEPEFESIDLNPVICSETRCIAADARIMLRTPEEA